MRRALALTYLCMLGLSACNLSTGDPREAVVKFLRAVRASDTVTILRAFTLEAPYTLLPDTGLWPEDDPRNDTIMAARLLAALSPDGEIHKRWLLHRMVVGDAEVSGDTALVEVTRLDQIKGVQVYNKFGMVNNKGYWQIYSFKTRPGPSL